MAEAKASCGDGGFLTSLFMPRRKLPLPRRRRRAENGSNDTGALTGRCVDRFEGVGSLDRQDAEEVEANVLGSAGGEAGASVSTDGDESVPAAKNQLASIKLTNIGISAFRFGLQRCDSSEF